MTICPNKEHIKSKMIFQIMIYYMCNCYNTSVRISLNGYGLVFHSLHFKLTALLYFFLEKSMNIVINLARKEFSSLTQQS